VKGSIKGGSPGKERGHLRALGAAVLAVALMTVPAVAASAGPPERFEEPFFSVSVDEGNELAVFLGITRDNACAWEAGGFEGPPPADGVVSLQVKETGKGAIVVSFQGEVSIELWQFDGDVPPLSGVCEATDDQDGPWATGMARWGGTDNDVDVSLTRTNSFGDRVHATLFDADGGAWIYSFSFRAQITKDDEFILRAEHATLTRKGN
jgi:hypothetical protein